jgi:outer membrane receptor protein involved in Fe transport
MPHLNKINRLVLVLYLNCFLANVSFANDANETIGSPPESLAAPTLQLPQESHDASESDEIYLLDDFVVSAENDKGYYAANSISATRTNALVKNTPINISVINEQMMEDLNILNDQDLAKVTSSVTEDPDGFSLNQLRIRGFRSLTQRYDLFWREITRDGYNIQRVDIVKGANSLMYGQADPGGQINSVPKMAQIGKDFANFKHTAGNKDYRRSEVDFNYSPSDKFALRLMGVDFSRDLDQLYEYAEISGATLEAMYRPNSRTQLRAHIETIELDQNLAPNMFVPTSPQATRARNNGIINNRGDMRFIANSPQDDTGGGLSYTLGTYRNEFPYSPDAIEYIPQEIIDDLELDPRYVQSADFVNKFGNVNPNEVTRDMLRFMYSTGISQDDRYSVTGPDKFNRRQGLITTADWTQQLTDDLQFKIAVNREDDDRSARARDGYSAGRVSSDAAVADQPNGGTATDPSVIRPYEPYVETFWRLQDGRTQANAFKSTLLWDMELDNNIPILGNSEHKILLGADWDQLLRESKMFHQVQDINALRDNDGNTGGHFFTSTDIKFERFFLSDGFGPNTPNIGFNGDNDNWALRDRTETDIQTMSAWFAVQSSFLNERLRTLAGLRYDRISTDFSLNSFRFGVAESFIDNQNRLNTDGDRFTYEDVVVNINDNNNTESKVSPTIGALFWLTDDIAVFANYAQSIQSPTSVELTPLGEIIPPVFGEGYEYGIRFDLLDGKINGQINAFYIEKENDTIVNYDFRLNDIYTYAEYGDTNPEIFFEDSNNPGTYRLQNDILPGKRVPGDISRSEGLEVEFFYNPNKNLSFVFSYSYNNLDALRIPKEVNPRFAQVWGQAPHNALLIGRYKFTDGALKGFSFGADQSVRSSSTIGEWYIEDDDDAEGKGTWYEINFDPEFITSGFINYQRKLGTGRSAPVLNLGLRINNLFDNTDLINRNKNAFHRGARQILISAKMNF